MLPKIFHSEGCLTISGFCEREEVSGSVYDRSSLRTQVIVVRRKVAED